MSEWQDISTAPRDGTPFLSNIVGPIACVTWFEAGREYPWCFFWHLGADAQGEEHHASGFTEGYGPSQWMPLPSTSRGGQEGRDVLLL